MHRIESRTYVGQPREVVTITTRVSGGGQAAVIVNGVDIGPNGQFPLPPDPGDGTRWQIALMGPLGATCVVGITVVDGSADGDFLICQAHNPAPVHFYSCSVVQAPAMRALRGMRGAKTGPGRRKAAKKATARKAAAKKPAPKKAATKNPATKKTAAKKTAAKKTGNRTTARRTARKGGRS